MSAALAERPSVYQDYSLDRKAEVLALVTANGGNVRRTSEDTGIHHATIQYWMRTSDRFAEIQPLKESNLSLKLKAIAHQCADMLPEMLPSASVREVVGAMAQSIEKAQLLDGQPTSITESIERQDITLVLQAALSEAIDVSPIDSEG